MTKKTAKQKRTGLRKPLNYLKTWGGSAAKDWTCRLTPRLRVGMVDEELPPGKEGGRKSWYLTLTQGPPDLLTTLGPVRGVPTTGTTILLFEDDVVALARYLEEGDLIVTDAAGRIQNGDAITLTQRFGAAAMNAAAMKTSRAPSKKKPKR